MHRASIAKVECNLRCTESVFTDFYFISSESGNYLIAGGKKGYLDLKEGLPGQLALGQDGMMNATVPGQLQLLVFAIPAGNDSDPGLRYDVIAASYNNADIVKVLEISAFDGNASSYTSQSDREAGALQLWRRQAKGTILPSPHCTEIQT